MIYEGNITKMRAELDLPVKYFFRIGAEEFLLNDYIGKKLKISFSGLINCTICGAKMKKSFGTGFCYTCSQRAPQACPSVMRPELSKSQYGIFRDEEFAKAHDLIPHYVYLAVSSGLKVGVTRHNQIPTRWIDQGASHAVRLAETPNRHIAGIIEDYLKQYFSDKTDWRAMLTNKQAEKVYDLEAEKKRAANALNDELKQYICNNNELTEIHYPVEHYPTKVESMNFDKNPIIEGILTGIKGQYLYFDEKKVINIRRHSGYFLKIEI